MMGISRLPATLRRRWPTAADRGFATVEIAVALPALVFILAIALWGVAVASAQVACVDAVRAGARAAARGEQISAVRSVVARAVPRGAQVEIERGPDTTTVSVSMVIRPPVHTALSPMVLREHAIAATEPGAGGGP
jgi:hypothetical protein